MRKVLTTEQQKLLVTRKTYLDFFEKNKNACLLGLNGTGKTLILKHHAQQHNGIYIDLTRTSISPENFAVEYVGTILHSLSDAPKEEYTRYLDIDFLTRQRLDPKSKDIIDKILNELQKIKPDQDLLLRMAFSFPATLPEAKLIVMDGFQEILAFNNYAQITDILEMFFKQIGAQKISYKLASSSVNSLMKRLDDKIPITRLLPFTESETRELCSKISKGIDAKQVHALSQGYSIVAEAICRRYAETKDEKKAFMIELSYNRSATYQYLSSIYHTSLNDARGATLLKSILKVMSQEPELRLTELARKIYRSSPVTKALLERLMEVDLVFKEDKLFKFGSPLLRAWCSLMFANIDFDQVPGKEELGLVFKMLKK